MVTEQFVANYNDANTQRYGALYPGVLYDYCTVALRKTSSRPSRLPIQDLYGGNPTPATQAVRVDDCPVRFDDCGAYVEDYQEYQRSWPWLAVWRDFIEDAQTLAVARHAIACPGERLGVGRS